MNGMHKINFWLIYSIQFALQTPFQYQMLNKQKTLETILVLKVSVLHLHSKFNNWN